MIEDDRFYEQAGNEVNSKRLVTSVMARAIENSNGDYAKAISMYVTYRVAHLKEIEQLRLQQEEESRKRAEVEREKQEREAELQRTRAEIDQEEEGKFLYFRNITSCPQCEFSGRMGVRWFVDELKCPKCNHRFRWHYISFAELRKRGIEPTSM